VNEPSHKVSHKLISPHTRHTMVSLLTRWRPGDFHSRGIPKLHSAAYTLPFPRSHRTGKLVGVCC